MLREVAPRPSGGQGPQGVGKDFPRRKSFPTRRCRSRGPDFPRPAQSSRAEELRRAIDPSVGKDYHRENLYPHEDAKAGFWISPDPPNPGAPKSFEGRSTRAWEKISCAGNPFPRGFEKSRIASGQPARGRERSTRLGTSWTWQPRLNPTQRQARVGGRIVWSDVYIPLRHCAHRGAARRKPCARTWAPRAMTRSEAQPVRKAVGKILSAARIRKIFSRWKKNLTAGAERWNGFPPQGLRWDICPNAARKNSFLPAESCSVARR